MAYRNGTYIVFHANGCTEPTETDMKYYRLLQDWHKNGSVEFRVVNSHEKTAAVRDSSKRETLRRALVTRLCNSKNLLLLIGNTTKEDRDWVPFEIAYAIDQCKIPIITCYTMLRCPLAAPLALAEYWPEALAQRIHRQSAHVIHIPFRKEPIVDAIQQFSNDNYPVGGGLGIYDARSYVAWGIAFDS